MNAINISMNSECKHILNYFKFSMLHFFILNGQGSNIIILGRIPTGEVGLPPPIEGEEIVKLKLNLLGGHISLTCNTTNVVYNYTLLTSYVQVSI